MSSILNALKKVEESGQAEETPNHPSLLREASFRRLSWRPDGWLSGRKRIGWLSSAIALAAVVGAYFWQTADNASPPVADSAKEVRAQLPPQLADTPPQPVSPPVRTVQPRPSRPPAQAPESPTGQAQTAVPPIQAPPPTSRVRSRESTAVPPAEARPSPARGPASSQERADAGRPSAPRTAEDSLSRLDESKLKVMAIAWAAEPSRRLAVINGHIVKEGEAVEGFSVLQIRKDDIIVSEGGRSWRAELNLKSQP